MQGKKRFITLTSEQETALQLGWKTGKKSIFRHRCHYILLSSQGKSISEISSFYEVTRQSISKWFTRYEQQGIGGLHTSKGQGYPPILRIDNTVEMNKVEELVEASPQNLKVVVAQLEKDFGKSLSVKTLQRILKKKWSWKRFRKVVAKAPDPVEYEEKKRNLAFLMLLFLTGGIDVRFGDETGFNLEPNVPYGWSREGEQVGIPSRKRGTLNVFGLLNVAGNLTSFVTTKTINSETIIAYLDEFVETIEKTTVVVLDNAPWHVSEEIEKKIAQWEEKGLLIFYLPTYSPHLNLIETLWRKIKLEWLKPKDFINKEKVHKAVNHILENYGNQKYYINFSIEKCYDNYG